MPVREETRGAYTLGNDALSLTEFLSRNECNDSRKSLLFLVFIPVSKMLKNVKKVEENANLLSANIRKQEEHMVAAEDIDYKTRYDHLLSSLRKKEKDIEQLEEKCLSFENRVLSLEQENDSLRLALKIIVQEKNECDSRPQKADDRWSLVENTHPAKSMKNKRTQHTIPSDNIGTRNRFEPLGNEV